MKYDFIHIYTNTHTLFGSKAHKISGVIIIIGSRGWGNVMEKVKKLLDFPFRDSKKQHIIPREIVSIWIMLLSS